MSSSERKTTVSTGAPWESLVGYSRAVRVGQYVAVAGSAAVAEDGSVIGVGDPFRQARHCIEIIAEALKATGAGLENVVRTRIFVTDISDWPEIARAHREAFAGILPATSMVEVARLIDPAMLVEIEADAVLVND